MIIQKRKTLALVLAFPVVVLLALTAYRALVLKTGRLVEIPVTGYDPRDLLSGHYIQYTVEYGKESPCWNSTQEAISGEKSICLDHLTGETGGDCKTQIVGHCEYNRFVAGIERFYIPEKDATKLDQEVRAGGAKIGVRVTSLGNAQVEYFEIQGKRIKD